MIRLFVNMVVIGALAAAHPSPPLAAVLVLGTDEPRRNIGGFAAGWVGSLVVIFLIGYLAGDGSAGDVTEVVSDVLEIGLGVALLVAAVVAAVRGGSGLEAAGIPPWVKQRMDRLRPGMAALIGIAVQPWAFTLAAALSVARDHQGIVSATLAFLVFGVLCTSLVLAVVISFLRHPSTAKQRMDHLQTRMVGSGRRTLITVSVVAALYLVGDGIYGLLRA